MSFVWRDIYKNFLTVPEAPTSVKALVMSADSILVSWLPPERPNGIITQYTVYYKEHGKSDSEVRISCRFILIFIP